MIRIGKYWYSKDKIIRIHDRGSNVSENAIGALQHLEKEGTLTNEAEKSILKHSLVYGIEIDYIGHSPYNKSGIAHYSHELNKEDYEEVLRSINTTTKGGEG